MPANKSHHYVPKFYLRNFTSAENSKSISLYNIEKKRLVLRAPIKGQCCRDYFYGKDPATEHGLAGIEGMAAMLFHRMQHERRMPRPFTAGHLVLCLHVVLQHLRTRYAAEAINEMVDGMLRETFRGHPKVTAEELELMRFGYDDPALISTRMALESYPIVMDLGLGALLCPEGHEFLTSDNPVVLHNQFFNWRKLGSNTGMGSKGLQVFFPVWPWLTIVLYDKDVYHFGDTKNSTMALATPQDVLELNVMQAVSASENLYMYGSNANVFVAAEKAVQFRRKMKIATKAFEQPAEGGRRRAIITTSREDIRTDAVLSFMKIPKRSKRWLDDFKAQRMQPAAVMRNPDLLTKFRELRDAANAGRAHHEDAVRSLFGVAIVDDTY